MTLFEWKPPQFGGATFSEQRDGARLSAQMQRVLALMQDHRWRTLREIAEAIGASESGASARVRDLRKARNGGHVVERRYMRDGLWEYRLLPAAKVL